jgi:hypothetical protein
MFERPIDPSVEVLIMTEAVTRILKLSSNDILVDVAVSVSWPVLDQQAWRCRWEINWPDRTRSNVGCGIDAMQALIVALQMIGSEIYCSHEHQSGRLAWTEDTTGYGFPVPNGIRDLLIGDDAKYI